MLDVWVGVKGDKLFLELVVLVLDGLYDFEDEKDLVMIVYELLVCLL